MRIMLIVTTMSVGGVQSQVLALASAHAAMGHEVRIVSLYGHDELESTDPFIRHYALGLSRSTPMAWVKGLITGRRIVRTSSVELIHGHAFHAYLFARLLGAVCKVPAISTIHSVEEGGRLHCTLSRLTFGLSSVTTAVSKAVAQAHEAKRGAPTGSVRIVPNGLNTQEFAPNPEERRRIRAELELSTHDTMLLCVGRLTEAKDIPNLLEAFKIALAGNIGHVHLFVAGDGPKENEVRERIDHLNLQAAVTLLGKRRDIPALLNGADLLVLSSAWEGLPMIIGEAMASETPVVATAVGGVPELVGDFGILAPPHDPAALAHAIVTVCQLDPARIRAMVTSARTRIHSEFEISGVRATWERLYVDLVKGVM